MTMSPPRSHYVIVGAGTCGLVVANRLSANAETIVTVVEPGDDDRDNENVTNPMKRGQNQGTDIDWQYKSIPQAALHGRELDYTAGRIVGGTSTINGMNYVRASKAEIDNWSRLGATGWDWESLQPYYLATERFRAPTPSQRVDGAAYDPQYHGRSGDVVVGFPRNLLHSDFFRDASSAWKDLGVQAKGEVNDGDLKGFTVRPVTADEHRRTSAAEAFYYPVANRPNLRLVKGTATEIVWREGSSAKPTARGLRYINEQGNTQILELEANGEIILSAGALISPIILEASGVGDASHLRHLGIDVKVDIPGVGENLQDQPDLTITFVPHHATPNVMTPYAAFVTARDVFRDDFDTVSESTRDKLHAWAQNIADQSTGVTKEATLRILQHQHDLIFKHEVAMGEVTVTSSDVLASEYWSLLPFSRGSVHLEARTKQGVNKASIDPRFFLVEFDLDCFIELSGLVQRFWSSRTMGAYVEKKLSPTDSELPPKATREIWSSYVRKNTVPNHHALGTCAMMAKELGGVVDANLRVFGTSNVRVVDASIVPMQLTGHLMATLYAAAARAADIISGATLKK